MHSPCPGSSGQSTVPVSLPSFFLPRFAFDRSSVRFSGLRGFLPFGAVSRASFSLAHPSGQQRSHRAHAAWGHDATDATPIHVADGLAGHRFCVVTEPCRQGTR